ncbi:TIGR02270 family protein [Aliikangiella sp. IMCC44359]|uniref:TIGR02270 family protein n=1 Tax=Aliikangiella sp. IMCC44359 TaxID=3459125 RepID=UPI00403AE91B
MKATNLVQTKTNSAFRDIFDQYAADASFLWELRAVSLKQPHYKLFDILEIEQRIEANLDGLMSSVEQAWDICLEGLEFEQAGEVFTASVVAFKSADIDKIKIAVTTGLKNDDSVKGLISALAWLPEKITNDWVQKFLASKNLDHKFLAIAVLGARRMDPGDVINGILQREDCLAHNRLFARTLRLIGELKLKDCQWALNQAFEHDDPQVKFWANWSAILLGNRSAVNRLQAYIEEESPLKDLAIQTIFRVLPIPQGRQWISQLAANPEQARTVIQATGVLGDPHAVPWLIEKMKLEESARLAGEAFTQITGIDLEQEQLSIETPDNIAVIPNNAPEDDSIEMDADENLAYPDVKKVAQIWQKRAVNYEAGKRYVLGVTPGRDVLKPIVVNGYQRQRLAAALEIAVLEADVPFVNVKARSYFE